jgi:hypothetical protein
MPMMVGSDSGNIIFTRKLVSPNKKYKTSVCKEKHKPTMSQPSSAAAIKGTGASSKHH